MRPGQSPDNKEKKMFYNNLKKKKKSKKLSASLILFHSYYNNIYLLKKIFLLCYKLLYFLYLFIGIRLQIANRFWKELLIRFLSVLLGRTVRYLAIGDKSA